MPEDIRDVDRERYWDAFTQRWTGLLSYRYLGRAHTGFDTQADADARDLMALRHDMRNSSGGIMAAPLCIASPEAGGLSDIDAVPNPVIASMHILDPARDVTQIEIRSETVRVGRQMGFSRSRIVDADDPARVIALSEGMGVSVGPAPPVGFETLDNPPIEVVDEPGMPPLHLVFGAERRGDGTWVLPELSDEMASPDAALHLGPIHVVLEAAATDAAVRAAGGDVQVQDWHVMFVARGKVGPFRVEVEPAPVQPQGRIGCRLTLLDEGSDDRVVTAASAVFAAV